MPRFVHGAERTDVRSKEQKFRHKQIHTRASGFFFGCLGKYCYPSKRVARAVIRIVDSTMTPYKCRSCKSWHVGHDRSGKGNQ